MGELRTVHTADAPEAIGPYSQAIVTEGWIFVSGQIPIDPATGELVAGDIGVQANRVLENVRAVVETAGGAMESVVKTTVYLDDMDNFGRVNEIYARHFGEARPARATIEAGGLPRGVAVEIDVIARVIEG